MIDLVRCVVQYRSVSTHIHLKFTPTRYDTTRQANSNLASGRVSFFLKHALVHDGEVQMVLVVLVVLNVKSTWFRCWNKA